jgi:hypothetical protein
MAKAKTASRGEWAKTAALVSTRFGVGADPRCEICNRMHCGPTWYSIKRRRFRCLKCFTPEPS